MKKKIALITSILVIIFIIAFANNIVSFIINVEWYKEVGYLSIYFIELVAVIRLMVPIFLVCYLVIWFYYKNIRKSIVRFKKIMEVNLKKDKIERRVFAIFDLILSFTIAYSVSTAYWYRILQFQNSSSFNTKDPIFNLDISFYVFKLPLIESIYSLIISLIVLLVIVTIVIYFILYASQSYSFGGTMNKNSDLFKFSDVKDGIKKFAGKQLAVLFAMMFLLLSFGYIIKGWDLVYSERGVVYGASYTDVHVSLLFFRILAIVCVISSVVIFISVLKSKVKPIVLSISVIFVLIVCEGIVSIFIQNVIVKSNEKALESPYIKDNIAFTRKAYNIDGIDSKDYPANSSMSASDIQNNMDTINNIKINSYKQSMEYYNQTQVLRYYYNFNDVDVDRYNIDGKLTEVFIAPREINTNALTGNADTWQNQHLSYTHGYGLVMSKVNSVTSEGQPDFVINDIPVNNKTGINIENPRIYFGESTNDYVIANNKSGEFDYPENGQDKTYNYTGKAGINATLMNRVLFAINKGDLNFLVSSSITSDSKILINRNIMDRVKKIAPFLDYDNDPYAVVDNGKLYWIIDAYTTTDRYPFSEPQNNINYIRNSVKVVVDAFDGDVNFYQVDKNDPIANSYNKIFNGIFKDVDSAPMGIRQHFRYPEDLFNEQCDILQKYHVTDPQIFYNSEDLWAVSQNKQQVEGDKSTNPSSYVVMKLPGEKKEETVLMEYFNVKGKENNMVSMLGARMDGDNYGKLELYNFPTNQTTDSPYSFNQKINQDPNISKEISLWNTQGSQVQFGDTSIVPINGSLLYVEPVYISAQAQNSIPEVKEIILSTGNNMVMAENMQTALQELFNNNNNGNGSNSSGQNNSSPNVTTPQVNNNSINQAVDIYNKAMQAEKNGDWTSYGEYIKDLGDTLKQLQK